MLDLKLLRTNPELIRDALQRRRIPIDLTVLLKHEAERRELLTKLEQERHLLKQESDAFARRKGAKKTVPPGQS